MRVKKSDGMALHELEGEAILYDGESKKVHVLNETARFLWCQCADAVSVEELCERLTEHYEIDAESARTDTTATIDAFLKKNIVATVDP